MSTSTHSPALQTALGFYEAWTHKDLERSLSFLADDVVVDSPNGRVEGTAAYREALTGWFAMFTKADLIDSFAKDDTAIILYECVTHAVPHVPAAEYFVIEDGKITYKRLVFDRGPFILASREG